MQRLIPEMTTQLRDTGKPLTASVIDEQDNSAVADEVAIEAHGVVINSQPAARLNHRRGGNAIGEGIASSLVFIDAIVRAGMAYRFRHR